MKNFSIAALVAAISLVGVSAVRAQVTAPVDVKIVLTPVCKVSSAPNLMTINYTSDGGAASGTSGFGVTCTGSLPYTMALNAGTGSNTAAGVTTYSYTDSTLELNYTLALTDAGTGNKAEQNYTITGGVAANQWGKCAAATCENTNTHTLTVAY